MQYILEPKSRKDQKQSSTIRKEIEGCKRVHILQIKVTEGSVYLTSQLSIEFYDKLLLQCFANPI